MQKTDGTGTTTYIGKLYVCDNGSCTKMIFAGGQRVAQKEVTGGATSYYHPDHLGSTSVVTDSAGNNEQDLAYYPYGDTFLDVGSKDVKFKYTGKERDDSTGLYFYEARYYDPFLGRFISADTIVPNPLDPQAFNRYSYVLNNPIIYTDPTGNFSFGSFFKSFFNALVATSPFPESTLYVALIRGDSITNAYINNSIFVAETAVTYAVTYYTGNPALGAAAGAAVGGGLRKAAGQDVDIAKNVGIAVLSSGLSYGAQTLPINWAGQIVASGLIGGGVSELAGGSFVDGFAYASITSTALHYRDISDSINNQGSLIDIDGGVEVANAAGGKGPSNVLGGRQHGPQPILGVGSGGQLGGSGFTGFTKHGINQAISREGVGVSTRSIRDTLKNPLSVTQKPGGETIFKGNSSNVILNKDGKVITVYPKGRKGFRNPK